MDIQGRTQPSYRPRGAEGGETSPSSAPASPSTDGFTPAVAQNPPATSAASTGNVIAGGAVPAPHVSNEKNDTALEQIMQDVRQDPKLAPDKPIEGDKTPDPAAAQQKADTPKKHSRMPIMVAILALVIAGALAVIAYFAFSGNRAEENGNKKINQVNLPTRQTADVSPEAVDQTSKAVDDELTSLNDSQDFDAAELGDQQLGL